MWRSFIPAYIRQVQGERDRGKEGEKQGWRGREGKEEERAREREEGICDKTREGREKREDGEKRRKEERKGGGKKEEKE